MSAPSTGPRVAAPAPAPATEPPGVPRTLPGFRFDLTRSVPGLLKVLRWRSFQYLVILPNLFLFAVFLTAGLVGTPVGNRNILIVFVWILWWFMLITVLVPLASRVWCTVCPFPLFGDWIQRLRLIGVRVTRSKSGKVINEYFGLNRRWPKRLTNIWLQNIGFLALCTFSALLVTRPAFSAWIFISLVAAATILALIYKLRVFCDYVCPVSGFLSLYSMTAMMEIRSRDDATCRKCKTKGCRVGAEGGWGCPWFVYMGTLERNNYCGMCMECLKSCPNDNIALNLRPFASDIGIKGIDEAYKGFIMLTLAMAYSVILLGPHGTIKDWANVTEVGNLAGFGIYALILWSSALVVLPAIFAGVVALASRLAGRRADGKPIAGYKSIFLGYSYTLVPLGLFAWIAFSVPLMFVNGSYIAAVISDPAGWGWDIFGTAGVPWTPVIPEYLVYVQIPFLLLGLFYALRRGSQIGLGLFGDPARARRAFIPIGAFCTAATCSFLILFAG